MSRELVDTLLPASRSSRQASRSPLEEIRLTRSEAVWLAKTQLAQQVDDAMAGDPFLAEHVNPSEELLWIVDRAIRDVEARGRKPEPLALEMRRKVLEMTRVQRAALIDALDRLPIESEEDAHSLNNWTFIGVHLDEDAPPKVRRPKDTG
jgi:hypothetical protein